MSKHSGKNTLLQIFRNIKDAANELKELVNTKQELFTVTATVDFSNNVLTNVSCTFDEIVEAHGRGDHIVLNADIVQLIPNGKAYLPFVEIDDSGACFSTVVYMDNVMSFVAVINADGSAHMVVTPLVSHEQLGTRLGGLTFEMSDTAPTVDNNYVVTFVDEG